MFHDFSTFILMQLLRHLQMVSFGKIQGEYETKIKRFNRKNEAKK
jgi:hypothetical protein